MFIKHTLDEEETPNGGNFESKSRAMKAAQIVLSFQKEKQARGGQFCPGDWRARVEQLRSMDFPSKQKLHLSVF